MKRVHFTILGSILILLGFLSLILGFIGLKFTPVGFIDDLFSSLVSFIIKLVMIFGGFIMFYMSRVNFEED